MRSWRVRQDCSRCWRSVCGAVSRLTNVSPRSSLGLCCSPHDLGGLLRWSPGRTGEALWALHLAIYSRSHHCRTFLTIEAAARRPERALPSLCLSCASLACVLGPTIVCTRHASLFTLLPALQQARPIGLAGPPSWFLTTSAGRGVGSRSIAPWFRLGFAPFRCHSLSSHTAVADALLHP